MIGLRVILLLNNADNRADCLEFKVMYLVLLISHLKVKKSSHYFYRNIYKRDQGKFGMVLNSIFNPCNADVVYCLENCHTCTWYISPMDILHPHTHTWQSYVTTYNAYIFGPCWDVCCPKSKPSRSLYSREWTFIFVSYICICIHKLPEAETGFTPWV